ncbi:MAG TPA: porin [Rhizomicrobium sp.]|jgi:phosphate-selective porin OprO/OprP|nr:porin [Rhizomicrobium sp.]
MRNTVSLLLAGTALAALAATPALAAARTAPARSPANGADPRIGELEQQLRDVQLQLADIRGTRGDDDSAAVADLKRSTSAHYADINNRLDAQTRVGLDNGRLTIASANGDFSLSLRSLIQFDTGYFAQGRNPASVDLNSGSNFRRAQFGFVGTAWKDWSYNFTYDFGGNGVEKNGYIYYAYLQYDGLAPFHVRAGALAPFAGIEDSTSSADMLFLERPSSVDIARGIGGSPGREGVDLFLQGDRYLLSVAYTGKKATDAATFDAQEAVVSRASWLAVNDSGLKWLVDANLTHVFKLADTVANSNADNISFSNGPELTVDATKTVNTGNIDAKKVTEFGFETAASYAGFYGQGGWFHFNVDRRIAVPNPDFSGWYTALTYSLTGEEHQYDPTTASFRGLRPAHPLGSAGGYGAWELKARYSTIDLDFNPLTSAASGGIFGGKQNVWTVGVNWYVNNAIRFSLDYDNIQANHVNSPANDISASAIALRSQISL